MADGSRNDKQVPSQSDWQGWYIVSQYLLKQHHEMGSGKSAEMPSDRTPVHGHRGETSKRVEISDFTDSDYTDNRRDLVIDAERAAKHVAGSVGYLNDFCAQCRVVLEFEVKTQRTREIGVGSFIGFNPDNISFLCSVYLIEGGKRIYCCSAESRSKQSAKFAAAKQFVRTFNGVRASEFKNHVKTPISTGEHRQNVANPGHTPPWSVWGEPTLL